MKTCVQFQVAAVRSEFSGATTINPSHYAVLVLAGSMITYAIWQSRLLWVSSLSVRKENIPERWGVFLNRQRRRRLQMAVMIGLAGMLMLCGTFTSRFAYPKTFMLMWVLAVFFLLWVMLLAFADMISINLFYAKSRHEDESERIRLQYELDRKIKEEKERVQPKDNQTSDEKSNQSGTNA